MAVLRRVSQLCITKIQQATAPSKCVGLYIYIACVAILCAWITLLFYYVHYVTPVNFVVCM